MPLTPATDKAGRYTGKGNNNEWAEHHANILQHIMTANVSVIGEHYDRACHLSYPGGHAAYGLEAAEQFWLGLLSSFPNAAFNIEHQIGRTDDLMPARSAIRWWLTGKHEGWGRFGKPTDTDVHVMGVSHVEFGPRGQPWEVTLFDEIAIWKQILLQKKQRQLS